MAQMFTEEQGIPDNQTRLNFVFMGYPYTPPLAKDDYARVVKDLQEELPIRFWYFLDEVTTYELMRKIWRSILRADLAVFDTSGGNANVAFELGLAVAIDKRCMTVLKHGEHNPLGSADLGYSERMEYTSATTLKERLRTFVTAKSTALGLVKELSFQLVPSDGSMAQPEVYERLVKLLVRVFNSRHISKSQAKTIMKTDQLASAALSKLRAKEVLKVEGANRGARYVFTDKWVYADHQVTGD